MSRVPRLRSLPPVLGAGALLCAGLLLGGCWEVLSHQDQEQTDDKWMGDDGTVEVTPSSLQLSTPVGTTTAETLSFREVSGEAAVEMELKLEGEGAEHVQLRPGRWSVIVVPAGTLEVEVTFAPAAGAVEGPIELVATTTGSPAELRVPIQLSLSGS